MNKVISKLWLASFVLGYAFVATAQEVTLKIHHFLPPTSTVPRDFIAPWAEKITKESNGRIKFQTYPSMQLGGTPQQLFDQAKDGVADIVWTLPGYTPGRFPMTEVFELPFMMTDAQSTSKALWDYVNGPAAKEYVGVKLLAVHVHGPGAFHMVNKPIKTLADLKGQKVRASNRQVSRALSALGATPVSMPVTQLGDALSKSVVDGALLPFEVVPTVKVNELTKFSSDMEKPFYTATFIFAMNQASYDKLPADLKKIIDANSGLEASAQAGKASQAGDAPGLASIKARNTPINIIPRSEILLWEKALVPVTDQWIKEVGEKGGDGKTLLLTAKELIKKYSTK